MPWLRLARLVISLHPRRGIVVRRLFVTLFVTRKRLQLSLWNSRNGRTMPLNTPGGSTLQRGAGRDGWASNTCLFGCFHKRNTCTKSVGLQEAQLSQRDRAMLRIIEYFAKSLKITQGHWNWYHSKLGYAFLFVFHSKYGSILFYFWDKARHWSKIAIWQI